MRINIKLRYVATSYVNSVIALITGMYHGQNVSNTYLFDTMDLRLVSRWQF